MTVSKGSNIPSVYNRWQYESWAGKMQHNCTEAKEIGQICISWERPPENLKSHLNLDNSSIFSTWLNENSLIKSFLSKSFLAFYHKKDWYGTCKTVLSVSKLLLYHLRLIVQPQCMCFLVIFNKNAHSQPYFVLKYTETLLIYYYYCDMSSQTNCKVKQGNITKLAWNHACASAEVSCKKRACEAGIKKEL